KLSPWIKEHAQAYAVGSASVEEIDRINIFHASHLAMERAVEALSQKPSHLLVDGKFLPKKWGRLQGQFPATAIIKGDLHSLSIACASIIAKVHRDQWMEELESEHPGYGFAVHKGYATPAHKKALQALGVCVLHRKSFAPVKDLLLHTSASHEQTALFE